MNAQRAILAIVALLGAVTVALPWRQLGILSTPLTVDPEASALVAGGFLVAALLTVSGDRSKPTRSSIPVAIVLSLVGLAVLALVAWIWSLFAPGIQPGLGVFGALIMAGILVFGPWTTINSSPKT